MAMFEICCRKLYRPCRQDTLCCGETSCMEYDSADLTPHSRELNSARCSWDEVDFKCIAPPDAHPLEVQPRYQHVVTSNPGLGGPCRPNESLSCETLHIAVMNEEPCLVRSYGRYAILSAPQPQICIAQVCDKDWTVRMPLKGTEVCRVEKGGSLWQFLGADVGVRTVELNHDGLRVWLIERSVSRANAVIECVDGVQENAHVLTSKQLRTPLPSNGDISRDDTDKPSRDVSSPKSAKSPPGTPRRAASIGRIGDHRRDISYDFVQGSSIAPPLAQASLAAPVLQLPPARVSIDRAGSPIFAAGKQGMTPISMTRVQSPYRFVGLQQNIHSSLLGRTPSCMSLVSLVEQT